MRGFCGASLAREFHINETICADKACEVFGNCLLIGRKARDQFFSNAEKVEDIRFVKGIGLAQIPVQLFGRIIEQSWNDAPLGWPDATFGRELVCANVVRHGSSECFGEFAFEQLAALPQFQYDEQQKWLVWRRIAGGNVDAEITEQMQGIRESL